MVWPWKPAVGLNFASPTSLVPLTSAFFIETSVVTSFLVDQTSLNEMPPELV